MPTRLRRPGTSGSGAGAETEAAGGAMRWKRKKENKEVEKKSVLTRSEAFRFTSYKRSIE